MSRNRRIYISVIGSGQASPTEEKLAEEVGRILAERGAIIVCGGLQGIMAAVCRGAKSADGLTIGVLPGETHADANPWDDIQVPTGLGYARNTIVVKAGLAVIAIAGAFGTLSEIGHALADGKSVVGLQTWELARSGVTDNRIIRASTPSEAVDLALSAAHGHTANQVT